MMVEFEVQRIPDFRHLLREICGLKRFQTGFIPQNTFLHLGSRMTVQNSRSHHRIRIENEKRVPLERNNPGCMQPRTVASKWTLLLSKMLKTNSQVHIGLKQAKWGS